MLDNYGEDRLAAAHATTTGRFAEWHSTRFQGEGITVEHSRKEAWRAREVDAALCYFDISQSPPVPGPPGAHRDKPSRIGLFVTADGEVTQYVMGYTDTIDASADRPPDSATP